MIKRIIRTGNDAIGGWVEKQLTIAFRIVSNEDSFDRLCFKFVFDVVTINFFDISSGEEGY